MDWTDGRRHRRPCEDAELVAEIRVEIAAPPFLCLSAGVDAGRSRSVAVRVSMRLRANFTECLRYWWGQDPPDRAVRAVVTGRGRRRRVDTRRRQVDIRRRSLRSGPPQSPAAGSGTGFRFSAAIDVSNPVRNHSPRARIGSPSPWRTRSRNQIGTPISDRSASRVRPALKIRYALPIAFALGFFTPPIQNLRGGARCASCRRKVRRRDWAPTRVADASIRQS